MELEQWQTGGERDEASQDAVQHELPPTDGGAQAWLLLAGCFMINVCIWGFAFSFGVLQEYYASHEPFSSSRNGIAAIGTTTTGLMYLLMPVYFLILQRWPYLKRYSCWASLVVIAAALIGASFAQSVPDLIGMQGILFALGGNMLFVPTVTYLDEWFVRKKGLAIGIMWAGDGTGGVVMPLLLQALLTRFGFRVTLRAIACGMVILMTPLLFFVKPRLPIPQASAVRPVDTSFLKTSLFWVLQAFNIIEAMGYFLPPNYLPLFAQYLGYNAELGSLTIVLNNITSVFGCIIVGILVDRMEITTLIFMLSIGAAVSILAIWGSSTSISLLFLFAATYGLTAGAYSTAWTGITKRIQHQNAGTDSSIVFGFLAAGRGIGSIISGPLSEGLIDGVTDFAAHAESAYSTPYGLIILFSGCTAFAGGLSFFVHQSGLLK